MRTGNRRYRASWLRIGRVEIVTVVPEVSGDLRARDQIVHTVERAQEGALATTRRADERGDPLGEDVERDPFDRQHSGVPNGDVARLELEVVDMPRALLRGRYMAAVARMESRGVPIDTASLARLRQRWEQIKVKLILAVE